MGPAIHSTISPAILPRILIVAAERGLGLGLAEQFFRRGWSVIGTARPGEDATALEAVGRADPSRLAVATIDVTDPAGVAPLLRSLGPEGGLDVAFLNAGIFGAPHQSAAECTPEEVSAVMMTNCFGPIRLAHRLVPFLRPEGGTLAFMSSHRGSVAGNREGGLELYRASKAALNMLARGIHATYRDRGLTVLSIHPGWVSTRMGTLDGTVAAEIAVEPSVRGVATVVERHRGRGGHLYRDWEDRPLEW